MQSSKRAKAAKTTAVPESNLVISMGSPVEIIELRVNGQPATREGLLARWRGGDRFELEAQALVYRQTRSPRPLRESQAGETNSHFILFAERGFKKFASSFRGRPMLIDHDVSIRNKGGKIMKSSTEESEGEFAIAQSLRLIKDWAVEGVLDGTIEEFSIGAGPSEKTTATCSVCGGNYWVYSECSHYAGQLVDLDDGGEKVIVEVIYSNAIGREVSGVTFPAVEGTGVGGVKTLSEAKLELITKAEPEIEMNETTLKILGLSEGADAKAIEAAVVELESKAKAETERADEAELALEAEKETSAELKAKNAELAESAKASEEETKETKIEALRQRALSGEGFGGALFAKDDARDKYFQKVAARSLEEGEAYLGTLSPGVVGAEMQSDKSVDPSETPASAQLSKREKRICKALGITPEQYLAAEKGEAAPTDDEDQED